MLLKGQTAIITGAGRGIGRAIAWKFVGEGAALLLTARSEKEVSAVAADIRKAGGRAIAIAADVSKEADCEKTLRAAHESFGGVHILVNNAGILGPVEAMEKIKPAEWDEVIAGISAGLFFYRGWCFPKCTNAVRAPS